ncbi:unnamed protein product [Amoebophrya sp. A25]|nr:unnamed protein product [Amoebophrya sp. A25]|eukprot:GSA25T00010279001.1
MSRLLKACIVAAASAEGLKLAPPSRIMTRPFRIRTRAEHEQQMLSNRKDEKCSGLDPEFLQMACGTANVSKPDGVITEDKQIQNVKELFDENAEHDENEKVKRMIALAQQACCPEKAGGCC